MSKGKELQVINSELMEEIRDLVAEGITAYDLPRIKVPTAGLSGLMVTSAEGETIEKTIRGVILSSKTARGLWSSDLFENVKHELSVEGVFTMRNNGEKTVEKVLSSKDPVCTSKDGYEGQGSPGGSCATCVYNQWAGDGSGKQCKETRQILFLKTGDSLPYLLSVPPTSIKNYTRYRVGVVQKGLKLHQVLTELAIEKKTSKKDQDYSAITWKMIEEVKDDQSIEEVKDIFSAIDTAGLVDYIPED